MKTIQTLVHLLEVGPGRHLNRLVPLLVIVGVIIILLNFNVYHGLKDAQSMDYAQEARQLARGQGFTTEFLRPYALTQLNSFQSAQGDLFPADRFPSGTPHLIPDTYNAPGYPLLLAGWFRLWNPDFDLSFQQIQKTHFYPADRLIPWLNQSFILLTGLLVFILAIRLFDERVAWLATAVFFGSELVWNYSLTALPTNALMFLATALIFITTRILQVGQAALEEEGSFWPAWPWSLGLVGVVALMSQLELPLLILLLPVLLFFLAIPRVHYALIPVVAILVLAAAAPWFWHFYKISGNPLGSNLPILLQGEGDFAGNQVYCTGSIPTFEPLFRDLGAKEAKGFLWNFEHAWNLLGSTPLLIFFAASYLHPFRQKRTHLMRLLVLGLVLATVAMTSLNVAKPETISPGNGIAIFLPLMLVIGAAYFFILLDRMNLEHWLLRHAAIILLLALSLFPLALSLKQPSNTFYAYPPYAPPFIKALGQLAHRDEWVISDMPWATAWYGDRGSLWLTDSLADFYNFNDNYCAAGVLLLTSVSYNGPISAFTSGEYHEWKPFITEGALPANFPLSVHMPMPRGGLEFGVWADRSRFP